MPEFTRRLRRSLYKRMPPALAGRLEYASNETRYFYPYGPAMNGQTARLEVTREIIEKLAIQAIIETGTYRGTTASWFAQFGVDLYTVEINRRFFEFSKRRLSGFKNVHPASADALSFFAELLRTEPEIVSRRVFFYLDAHRPGNLPLREEMQLIRKHFRHAVILIDDFQVPDDDGYGYDDYGPGQRLTLEYLAPVSEGLAVFFPATASRWETGARRGWVVVSDDPEFVAVLKRFPLLRTWPAAQAA